MKFLLNVTGLEGKMGSHEGEMSYHRDKVEMKAHMMMDDKPKEVIYITLKERSTLRPYSPTNGEFIQYLRGMEEGSRMELEPQNKSYSKIA